MLAAGLDKGSGRRSAIRGKHNTSVNINHQCVSTSHTSSNFDTYCTFCYVSIDNAVEPQWNLQYTCRATATAKKGAVAKSGERKERVRGGRGD